ncbi:MAG: maltose alpha-D-glucosyltransferase [Methyloceanibacter sp.]|uniref:maltose alpha-D-glucosyltransferase n=1 Tax=Methyloceanibacter sp. TaxID=1965321 RepID=UPI003D6D9B36
MIDRNDRLWYKNAVIYELHIKAFYDADNDGIGDFAGLVQKLDYLQELGVTAVWLLPFYPSPFRDDGYDIADYSAIHPTYGAMRDFRQFVAAAHARGIRVITELVVNHTSDQHPWFQRARNAKPGSVWRDYYVWSDTDQKYPGTRIIFLDTETSNWTWDPVAQAYFWHRFYSHQPDLNYDNPRVLAEILRVLRFWLDMGVDGLRLDAVPYLVEREGTINENLPATHEILKRFRAELDQRYPDRMLLAEANQWPEDTAPYFGDGDECHMAFHFPLMPRIFMSLAREDRYPVTDIISQTPTIPDLCQWAIFLRNHDELTLEMVTDSERDYLWETYATDQRARLNLGIRRRLAPLLDNDRRKIELLTGLLLSMPGAPVLYYGDELGMGDNFYLGDRDGVRTPMQWSADRNGGFSRADPQRLYLPPIMDPIYGYETVNVEAQQKHANSLLNWNKRMIAVRQSHKAFGHGKMTFLRPRNRKVLAYLREHDGDVLLCVFNLSRSAQAVELDLGAQKGKVPIELTGASTFPPIGTLPYLLTLPAYGFYWFTLADASRLPSTPELAPESLPELETYVLGEGWNIVESQRGDRERIDRFVYDLLPNYLARQRWLGPKDIAIVSAMPQRLGELPQSARESFLLLAADVALQDGAKQRYFLPLALSWGEQDLRHDSPLLPYLLAKIRRGPRAGIVFDAAAGETFPRALLKAMVEHTTLPAFEGELRLEASEALRALDLGEETTVQRATTGEQAHTSMTLGDRVKLKIARRLRAGMDPGIEMGRYLAKTGFTNSPRYLGSLEHVDGSGTPTALAVAFEHVRNQGDGWTVVVNALDRELEEASLAGPPLDGAVQGIPYSLSLIETIGRRTGELHRVFAEAGAGDPDFAPEPVTKADLEEWTARTMARAEQAFAYLEQLPETADDEVRAAAVKLLGLREAVLKRIETLVPKIARGNKLRLHNDYHLAKVLVAENDVYIVDFEGEPDQPVAERRQKAPPSRDIATMLRSFDYAARTAVDRQKQRGASQLAEIEALALRWRSDAERRFLKAYGMARDDSVSGSHLAGGELLPLFLADKLFHEIVYEGANRPVLLSIPLRAALELVEPMHEPAGEETAPTSP